ncbi:MAG: sucrase ferredoxin, partial [Cyanobacteria bacterium P01_F01_bin.4]
QLAALVRALLFDPTQVSAFLRYQQPFTRNLFVCTHTHYDLACGRFGTPLYRTLRQRYARAGQLNVWQTAHFGGHNFAPTLIDFPIGQFWGHLQPDILETLVYRQGDVTQLRPFYRGWSGVSRWAQIAEREIWMQQGWKWLTIPKVARVVRRDPGRLRHRLLRWVLRWIPTIRAQVLLKKLERKLNWAEVEIIWADRDDNSNTGSYHARVEISHTVMSQLRSGESEALCPVKQYRIIEI